MPCPDFILRFNTIAQRYPHHEAIRVDNDRSITYSSLALHVMQLSNILLNHQIGPGHLVAIHITKSPEYLISLLAIWMTGAAFVPIDPALPDARRQFFLTESNPNLIIYNDFRMEVLHKNAQYANHLAYILFTSGSTGQPKGVLVSHAGLVNFIDQQIELFQITASDRALFYVSTQFDASISDLGTAFLSGATLCLTASDPQTVALHLPHILKKNQITHLDIPPSLLATLDIDQMPRSLKTIIIGGESCPVDVVHQWASKIRLINVYGPTEATVCTSMMCCTEQSNYGAIGSPIAQIEYDIFDEQLQPTQVGELHISGVGLALGYLNNNDLTQKKFILLNNKTYYKTGDLVTQEKTGHYLYLGRIDRQFKIRGQLVEPEEIEAALYQHPAVICAAVIDDGSEHRKKLLAMVEATNVTSNILCYFLKSMLPSWMIPSQIFVVDRVPKNTNGKIDYAQIKTMYFCLKQTSDIRHRYDAHQHLNLSEEDNLSAIIPEERVQSFNEAITQKLQRICQEVLALPAVPSIHDDLFHTLGASSLDMIKIIVYAELEGLYLSTELLNHLPTIYDLSAWVQYSNSLSTEAMPAAVLKRECIENRPFDAVPVSKSNHLFITGVTGYLGIHLLDELLLKTKYPITCLVRAKSKHHALDKIKETAKKYNITINQLESKIHIITGDVSSPQLGLDHHEWNTLCQEIGAIYHCAAEVNMAKSFEALKQTNLEGTKEIARLALSTSRKKLYYMSTLSVFVATDQNSGRCREDDNLRNTQHVYGGYAQTKWAAEYFLQQSALDVTIFRLGLITGHSQSGQCSEHDYLALFVKGLQTIGSVPDGHWDDIHFDATPVDFAAQAIVYLSNNAQATRYHIVNTQRFSLRMVVHAMAQCGIALRLASRADWLMKNLSSAAMAASYMALCRLLPPQNQRFERFRTMDLFQATHVEFEQTNTQMNLSNTGIICPEADGALLHKYMAHIINAS